MSRQRCKEYCWVVEACGGVYRVAVSNHNHSSMCNPLSRSAAVALPTVHIRWYGPVVVDIEVSSTPKAATQTMSDTDKSETTADQASNFHATNSDNNINTQRTTAARSTQAAGQVRAVSSSTQDAGSLTHVYVVEEEYYENRYDGHSGSRVAGIARTLGAANRAADDLGQWIQDAAKGLIVGSESLYESYRGTSVCRNEQGERAWKIQTGANGDKGCVHEVTVRPYPLVDDMTLAIS